MTKSKPPMKPQPIKAPNDRTGSKALGRVRDFKKFSSGKIQTTFKKAGELYQGFLNNGIELNVTVTVSGCDHRWLFVAGDESHAPFSIDSLRDGGWDIWRPADVHDSVLSTNARGFSGAFNVRKVVSGNKPAQPNKGNSRLHTASKQKFRGHETRDLKQQMRQWNMANYDDPEIYADDEDDEIDEEESVDLEDRQEGDEEGQFDGGQFNPEGEEEHGVEDTIHLAVAQPRIASRVLHTSTVDKNRSHNALPATIPVLKRAADLEGASDEPPKRRKRLLIPIESFDEATPCS